MFDGDEGERQKEAGMALGAANRAAMLAIGREVARKLALRRADRCITADDVGRYMKANGLGELGPAAGSLFKVKKDWQWTGERRASKRTSNHGRELKVWKYIGS